MDSKFNKHKELMDKIYEKPQYPKAIDLWGSFYADNKDQVIYSNWRHNNIKRQKIENLVFEKLIKPNNKILDIGCGKGFFLRRIYENFGDSIDYYGVDISEVAINLAKKYFMKAKYTTSSGENLPFENNSFNYVQLISTLWHVVDQEKVLKEAHRVLIKGGFIYMVIHKKSIDPFLLFEFYRKLKKSKITSNKVSLKKTHPSIHTLSLDSLRNEIDRISNNLGLTLIDKKIFVSHIQIGFYRKLKVPMFFLIKIADILNKLPFTCYKNLEYRIYRK
ncbi:hypothetical protein LCGC14_1116500 [marine sediment metagenome]|uniref:Methyltransferase type 11 domain-containing protein n=1 Tax=marine sediment metagenome TaxID=412755 RepID=A0A0F9M541_9ZZZZ